MKRLLSVLFWPLAALVAVLGVWVAANAVDEDLSPQARATLAAGEPTASAITEDNGYVWMTSLLAPASAEPLAFARSRLEAVQVGSSVPDAAPTKLPSGVECKPDEVQCFPTSAESAEAINRTLSTLAEVDQRASRMRSAKYFREVSGPASIHASLPDMRGVIYAQQLAFAKARLAASRGDWETVVATLEADAAFNRRVLGDVKHIVSKIVATRALGRSALFTEQLWRAHGGELEQHRTRLATVVSDLSIAQLSLNAGLDQELAMYTREINEHGRRSLYRFADATETQSFGLRGDVETLFYLPNATANLFVQRAEAQRPALNGVTASFDSARKTVLKSLPEGERPWYAALALRNPTGHVLVDSAELDYTQYQASLHDLRALLTLIRARLTLPPAATAADWEALVASKAFTDPYTNQPLTMDPQFSQPAIAVRRSDGWPRAMVTATGGKLVGGSVAVASAQGASNAGEGGAPVR